MERSNVLEVRLRAQPARAARWRAAGLAVAVSVGFMVCAYLGLRGWVWLRDRFIYDKQAFALNTIEVHTDGWITLEQVRRWAGIKLGENLLTIDLARIQRDLELVPQVESASVQRLLPHLLRLRVVERVPVARVEALLSAPGGELAPAVLYLDEAAVVLPPPSGKDQRPTTHLALEALPVVRGINSLDLRPGQPVALPGVRAALRLLAEFDRSPMAGQVDLRSVDVSIPEMLQVSTEQGAEVIFGLNRADAQLHRWRLVHDAGRRLGKHVAALDLSVSNNCPLLWQEASAVPPVKSKVVQPSRHRKKNV